MEEAGEFVDSITCDVRRPGGVASSILAVQLHVKLETLCKKTIMLLQLLDNTTFYARTEE
jgi:hypothetical protein